jgi:hypothetical protein
MLKEELKLLRSNITHQPRIDGSNPNDYTDSTTILDNNIKSYDQSLMPFSFVNNGK